MLSIPERSRGKLSTQEQLTQRALTWIPWILTGLAIVPLPILFLVLFFVSASADSAVFYLLLSLASFGLGLLTALLIMISFWLYRRRWSRRLRDRLAADGITAGDSPVVPIRALF